MGSRNSQNSRSSSQNSRKNTQSSVPSIVSIGFTTTDFTSTGINTVGFGISAKDIWIFLPYRIFRNPTSYIWSTRLCASWITVHRSVPHNTVDTSHNATTGTFDQNYKSHDS